MSTECDTLEFDMFSGVCPRGCGVKRASGEEVTVEKQNKKKPSVHL